MMLFGILCFLLLTASSCSGQKEDKVSVFTVATNNNHGLERFLRSAQVYGINVKVLGRGQKWAGGDMNFPGGGHKVNLLKDALNQLIPDKDHIIIFTDSYDVLYLSGIKDIVNKFKEHKDTRVLFSAEPFCWPDANLALQYPVTDVPNPYLNSGAFMGYLPEMLEIVNYKPVKNNADDQLYYTHVYLNAEARTSLKITLDSFSSVFQNLNGALSDVQLEDGGPNVTKEWFYLKNVATQQRPLVVHGNGPSKLILNNYGNYLAKSWSSSKGCTVCDEKRIVLKEESLPELTMAVFIELATPFMEEFLQQIHDIDYPKEKIHLILRNNIEYHESAVADFFEAHSKKYATAKRIKPSDFMTEAEARNVVKERCVNSVSEYLFSVDSLSRVGADTLRHLLSTGYDVVAPMLTRPGMAWSNFWGTLSPNGYYARSHDYMDIVNGNIKGIWNVPFITNCYLVKMSVLRAPAAFAVTHYKKDVDPDMAFCASLRDAGIFMHVSNEKEFGHIVNPETFDPTRTHPDIYQVMENSLEWENRYIHKNYTVNFEKDRKHLMPCPDVYWFPLMTDRFCDEWVGVMEAYGQWSSGSNNDDRLNGGYEAVPTRDIHMTQVGLDKQWLHILKEYVQPLQKMVFLGYYHNPPVSIMNFVVRYRPDEQPSLRPHHDTSTYTINLALNTPQVDFEGGGCNFLRYNCSVRNTKKGWLLMHPGRLTHFHEGLLVTQGTRYIMISFVDP